MIKAKSAFSKLKFYVYLVKSDMEICVFTLLKCSYTTSQKHFLLPDVCWPGQVLYNFV